MVEIVYEYADSWPETGPLQVNIPAVMMDIFIPPDAARRRANGYLGMNIGLLMGSSEPRLVLGSPPKWRLAVHLHLPSTGKVGQVGTIEVNALTGEIIPPSAAMIESIQERARDLTLRFTSATEPAL